MSHAILSPSAASRWLACTPSARLEQRFKDKAGQAAAEGTLAHTLGELMIGRKAGLINPYQYKAGLRKVQEHELYQPEMLDYIGDYSDRVIERYSAAQAETADAKLYLETRLDLTAYVQEGFGTGDVGIVADHALEIIDLKYGKGVPVSAEKNKQMMLYALGWLHDFDYLYDIHTIRMIIDQPRLNTVSIWEISVVDLRAWAEEELRPKAAMAFEGIGDYAPGDHCRFCKAAGTCKALADYNLELAKLDFQDAALLTDAEVADILKRADLFTKWLAAVQDHALYESVHNGKRWPGLKLVEGRSNRKYADEAAVALKLIGAGLADSQIYEAPKLLGITAMEKAISKAIFQELLAPLVVKPAGKPTLVPQSDKRPEYSSAEGAAADFAEFKQ